MNRGFYETKNITDIKAFFNIVIPLSYNVRVEKLETFQRELDTNSNIQDFIKEAIENESEIYIVNRSKYYEAAGVKYLSITHNYAEIVCSFKNKYLYCFMTLASLDILINMYNLKVKTF